MKHILLFAFSLFSLCSVSQVAVSSNGSSPDPSAGLDVNFDNRGLLPPRLSTAQRDAIADPAGGLRIYNTDTHCENFYNAGINRWMELCGTCPGPQPPDEGVHVPAPMAITWNWEEVSGADGYKWNTTNSVETATDVGPSLTHTQTGLASETPYNLYVWSSDICGISSTATVLSSTTTTPPCVVGNIGPAGGRIFYCGDAYPGFIGLEAAPSDQSTGASWGCSGSSITGADALTTGSGEQNTAEITAECGSSTIAAKICEDLDVGGFNDWFLPSVDELSLMYSNLYYPNDIGGFSPANYWSSTEYSATRGWHVYFPGGGQDNNPKNNLYRVRAARKF